MKMNKLSILFACALMFASPVFAQEVDIDNETDVIEDVAYNTVECSAVNALKPLYGNVMVQEEKDTSLIKLILTVPRSEIENMLTMVVSEKWYPSNLIIQGVGTDNSLVTMKISRTQNDSARRFRVLQKLCNKDTLPWKNGTIDNKEAYLASIETDFKDDFVMKGETIKSNLIFKNLVPKIRAIGADKENLDSERFASKENFDRTKIFTRETYYDSDTGINGQPFFEHGTYKDDANIGRYMVFTLRCKW